MGNAMEEFVNFTVRPLPLEAAKNAAFGLMSADRRAQLSEALRALRAATVDAGAAPPVMVYA